MTTSLPRFGYFDPASDYIRPSRESFYDFLGGLSIDHYKTAEDLLEEVWESRGAVYLENNLGRWIDRYAYSAQVCLMDFHRGIFWREVARKYWNSMVIPKEKNCSMSETVRRIKDPENGWRLEFGKETIIRSIWEEMREEFKALGYSPQDTDLEPLPERNNPEDVHESSTWHNVVSHVTSERYALFLDLVERQSPPSPSPSPLLGKEIMVTKDYGGLPQEGRRFVECFLRADPIDTLLSKEARSLFERLAQTGA